MDVAPRTPLPTLSLLACALCASCASGPRLPGPEDPHAVVKLVVRHHTAPGPYVDEVVRINGVAALRLVKSQAMAGAVEETTVRIWPGTARWQAGTFHYHTETRLVTETYTTTESYPCGTNPPICDSCGPTTRMCTRSVPRSRVVSVTDRIAHARCATSIAHAAVEGAHYTVELEAAGDRCSLRCSMKLAFPVVSGRVVDCPPPPTTEE